MNDCDCVHPCFCSYCRDGYNPPNPECCMCEHCSCGTVLELTPQQLEAIQKRQHIAPQPFRIETN